MIPPPSRRHPAALRLATLAATHTTTTTTATPFLLQDSPGRRYPGMELYVPGQITTCENNYPDMFVSAPLLVVAPLPYIAFAIQERWTTRSSR